MPYRLFISIAVLWVCGISQVQADSPGAQPNISYVRDIQPILTEKCVACHACNDAPCQLNLGAGEGVARGASKIPVYDGERSTAQAPTRLFMDASGPRHGPTRGSIRCWTLSKARRRW